MKLRPDFVVTELRQARAFLADSRATHLDWAQWFESNPGDVRIKELGNAKFHRDAQAGYEKAMTAIDAAIYLLAEAKKEAA